ncbi:MAG: hypothetical protein KDJ75_07800 [Alphaproteobacteria bacterium]|nr:hypothetical protein [Alphaproteobacteria bacterium]
MTVYGFDPFLNCVNGIDGIPLTRDPGECAVIQNGQAEMHSQTELSSTFARTQQPPPADKPVAEPALQTADKPSFS